MPYYKFTHNDVFHNTIKTHPKCEFLIHNDVTYYNGYMPEPNTHSSETGTNANHVPSGHLSLYEININRKESEHGGTISPTMIYPFITKEGTGAAFKTISTTAFQSFAYGDVLTGSYPLSASISVKRYVDETEQFWDTHGKERPQLRALKNTLNSYSILSPHYAVGDKMEQKLALINIPSIFYGSAIEKGSVSLKYHVKGELIAELQDTNKDGALYQVVGPQVSNGEVAGVVLYNEGFVILTGDWSLDDNFQEYYIHPNGSDKEWDNPKWIYWGSSIDGLGVDEGEGESS